MMLCALENGNIVTESQRGAVRLQYMTTEEKVADVLTKPLSRTKFEYFRDKIGMVPLQRECSHLA
jgi:hypothetical protein